MLCKFLNKEIKLSWCLVVSINILPILHYLLSAANVAMIIFTFFIIDFVSLWYKKNKEYKDEYKLVTNRDIQTTAEYLWHFGILFSELTMRISDWFIMIYIHKYSPVIIHSLKIFYISMIDYVIFSAFKYFYKQRLLKLYKPVSSNDNTSSSATV